MRILFTLRLKEIRSTAVKKEVMQLEDSLKPLSYCGDV